MHNAAFKFCGMPHEYKSHQHSSLKDMESNLRDPHFGGASITAPFKTEVMHLVNFMSREAKAIGAVNTLIPLRSTIPDSLLERNRAGPVVAFYGENTDWIGMYTCVSRNLSPVNTVNARTTALVLGAGGMARAAVYAMIRLGVRNIYLQNRTLKKAEELASYFNKWSTQDDSRAASLQKSDWDLFFEKVADGTGHFDYKPSIHVLHSMDEPWPIDANPPTIVISSLPGRNFGNEVAINNTIPANWLASQTGGVAVEVSNGLKMNLILTQTD
jgi:shikimate 5-dehydrogenase